MHAVELDGESGTPPVRVRMFSANKRWREMHPTFWHKVNLPYDVPGHEPAVHQRVCLADPVTALMLYERTIVGVEAVDGKLMSLKCSRFDFKDVVDVPNWLFDISQA